MSDRRGGAAGAFLLGVAVGAVLGLLFAPGAGTETRAQLWRGARNLRDLAGEKAGGLKELLESGEGGDDDREARAAREELERRLAEARERRRSRRAARREALGSAEEEDEPVA